jgi:transposase InsO family protein
MQHTPYGYKIENGIAVIDQEAAARVKELYRIYLSGLSLINAAKEAGITGYHSSIARMLTNKRYLGDGYYPQIIDKNTFDQAEAESLKWAEMLGRIREPSLKEESRNNYGARKIKKKLNDEGKVVSRRKIGRIMRENGLVSTYTIAQYKPHKKPSNEDLTANEVKRDFSNREQLEVVVIDLTYVRVAGKWNYVCILIDLFNREIIGYSAGPKKDAILVYQAFSQINANLNDISIFHTDRGSEFKNNVIEGLIETFNIKRSLSQKGCPYDNAVAEATFKVFKTEFSNRYIFKSLDELSIELADYVNWYNNIRIHSTLGYLTPVEFKRNTLKKIV